MNMNENIETFNVKSLVSRKALHRLSIRQRNRVRSEIRSNLCMKKCNCNVSKKLNNIRDTRNCSGSSTALGVSSFNFPSISGTSDFKDDTEDDTSSSSCNSEMDNFSYSSSSLDISNEVSFSERLVSCRSKSNPCSM